MPSRSKVPPLISNVPAVKVNVVNWRVLPFKSTLPVPVAVMVNAPAPDALIVTLLFSVVLPEALFITSVLGQIPPVDELIVWLPVPFMLTCIPPLELAPRERLPVRFRDSLP